MSALASALRTVAEGRDLSAAEMAAALGEVMDGKASEVHLAGFLVGLRVKGESVDEVVGAVSAMRARSERLKPTASRLLDTCGTGGDGAGTFNISTAVAFVAAAAGIAVAKHGNRAISSSVGSADVLEGLGVRIDLDAPQVARCIDEIGIGFMFAPRHHQTLRHAGPVRRALGFRTVLNLLGPMTNPATATHQLVGVFAPHCVPLVAEVLGRLGTHRALVVHGCDGLDEITLAGPTTAALWNGDAVERLTITPESVGLPRADASELAGTGTAAGNAAIVRGILAGESGGAPADIVRLNAGAALWVAGEADSLQDGVARATELLASGAALERLDALAGLSHAIAAEIP